MDEAKKEKQRRKPKCLYMIVTQDKYELPLFVGDVYEVAEKVGLSSRSIYNAITHFEHGRHKTCRFRKVKIKE